MLKKIAAMAEAQIHYGCAAQSDESACDRRSMFIRGLDAQFPSSNTLLRIQAPQERS